MRRDVRAVSTSSWIWSLLVAVKCDDVRLLVNSASRGRDGDALLRHRRRYFSDLTPLCSARAPARRTGLARAVALAVTRSRGGKSGPGRHAPSWPRRLIDREVTAVGWNHRWAESKRKRATRRRRTSTFGGRLEDTTCRVLLATITAAAAAAENEEDCHWSRPHGC